GGALGYRVMGNQQVGIGGQAGEPPFAAGVAGEDDGSASRFDSPGQRGDGAMDNAYGRGGQTVRVKDVPRHVRGSDVVGLPLVAALLLLHEEIAQVPVDAAGPPEEAGHELGGRGHEVVSGGAVNRQWPRAVLEPGGLDERREVAAVVDVKVAEQDDVELRHLR